MKNALIFIAVVVFLVVVSFAWGLHFWMPAGQTIHIGSWNFGNYEFEVWQSKNHDWSEPFSTALFARTRSNQVWTTYYMGHQDVYLPKIRLYNRDSSVEVFRDGKQLGMFDLNRGIYRRSGQTEAEPSGTTSSPSNWMIGN